MPRVESLQGPDKRPFIISGNTINTKIGVKKYFEPDQITELELTKVDGEQGTLTCLANFFRRGDGLYFYGAFGKDVNGYKFLRKDGEEVEETFSFSSSKCSFLLDSKSQVVVIRSNDSLFIQLDDDNTLSIKSQENQQQLNNSIGLPKYSL